MQRDRSFQKEHYIHSEYNHYTKILSWFKCNNDFCKTKTAISRWIYSWNSKFHENEDLTFRIFDLFVHNPADLDYKIDMSVFVPSRYNTDYHNGIRLKPQLLIFVATKILLRQNFFCHECFFLVFTKMFFKKTKKGLVSKEDDSSVIYRTWKLPV